MKATAIVISMIIFALAAQCWAGDNRGYFRDASGPANANIKFALHLVAHGTNGCGGKSTPLPVISTFGDIVRRVDTVPADLDVFTVVFDYDSLSTVEYGLTWPAAWGSASTLVCVSGALKVGGIINPGDGMAFAWAWDTACKIPQDGRPGGNTPPFFVTSYSWLGPTTAGAIEFIKNPTTQNIGVVECRDDQNRSYEEVYMAYFAAIQQAPDSTAVEPTSWGAIKAMFK